MPQFPCPLSVHSNGTCEDYVRILSRALYLAGALLNLHHPKPHTHTHIK